MEFTTIQLNRLHSILTKANVTDSHISRGVRLTQAGTEKLARKFKISTEEVDHMILELSKSVLSDLSEGIDRFTYEEDYMGNITLRDSKSGKECFLQGDNAFSVSTELKANLDKHDQLISPYFEERTLMEDDGVADAKNGLGTFNFPYKGMFATASYWLDGMSNFKIEIVSLRDNQGEEVEIDESKKTELTAIAMKWIDKI